ncbi:MAG: TatD family hydrolase [Clostridia bacterium]|nr:TatD family hydrolase [Clostridia bacterium]
MKIFDTHAHYTDKRFTDEIDGGVDALLAEVFSSGVEKIINVATTTKNSAEVIAQAAHYGGMYAAIGIHPSDIDKEISLDDAIGKLSEMLERKAENKIVAIGEIGLDYYWEPYDKAAQAAFFEAQLELAKQYDLPVVIHDREAHGDVFEIILKHPSVRGVLHSYSGSAEMARELVRRGWYISFSGVVTFKNAERVRSVAQSVPVDRLLLETDCPYLAPVPHRGKLNRSDYIAYTSETLGALHEMTALQMQEQTYQNAIDLFKI